MGTDALACDHGFSGGAIRTAVADLLPDHTAIENQAQYPAYCSLLPVFSSW
ncbi:hypothetical protein [Streptomyces pratensis]|uniref:hypothetical protein n=1 Tax=Streptomyces pratensis TaxID=1169025 RepID=UPI00362BA4D9